MVDLARVTKATRELLIAIGEDPDREGLKDTPGRVARAWQEFADFDAGRLDTAFSVEQADQMIVVSGIRVWSMCEHHLLPFWCDIAIGYIANDRLIGLSKLARIAQQHAHRLQIQERLTAQIADNVASLISTQDVAVIGRGEHLCMTMRGAKSASLFTTSAMRGAFRDSPQTRQEFLLLAGSK